MENTILSWSRNLYSSSPLHRVAYLENASSHVNMPFAVKQIISQKTEQLVLGHSKTAETTHSKPPSRQNTPPSTPRIITKLAPIVPKVDLVMISYVASQGLFWSCYPRGQGEYLSRKCKRSHSGYLQVQGGLFERC